MQPWPFCRVLVANRGEIAARLLRGIQACGLEGVLVYHALDRDTPAVALAQQAIEITGDTPVAAYLDGVQILRIAQQTGAGAIHPGYGFLSENAAFARAVAQAGLVFIGPAAEHIALMGDKVRARAFVEGCGFPVAPSAVEEDDPGTFLERARAIGVPLLIKPAAGGGGKGMHIVQDLAQLESAVTQARNEAQRYFGDGRLYVERYIENPRHIEVQVLGDACGHVVHLFERECSVQRRFQKILEESPAPHLGAAQRQAMCDAAVGIAQAAQYRNAGTVEFIVGADGKFYFLEMNTRLQVEHPVTETVTGIDLVREQLRIAAGESLGYGQDAVRIHGHAIECRIYAEDPGRGFMPATGSVHLLRHPHGVRVDSGVVSGQVISAAFDPMLAKLIVHAPTREAAIARARQALGDYVLLGCQTNTTFLQRLLDHPAFVNGQVHTGFLDANPQLAEEPELTDETCLALLAAASLLTRSMRDMADSTPDLHAALGEWRN